MLIEDSIARRPTRIGLLGWILVAMPLLALAPKYVLIERTLGTAHTQIFATGFGFGDYTRHLYMEGSFRSCSSSPFNHCGTEACNYSTRMPLLPILYSGLASIVGTDSTTVALAKCVLAACLLASILAVFVRDVRPSARAVVLLYVLYFGPQALKHGASLEYEEGLLIDLQVCLAIAVTYLLRTDLPISTARHAAMAFVATLIATSMYFVKTTALLTLAVVVALLLRDPRVARAAKAVALACVAIPFLCWIAHNYASSGALHLSSSWNGENLYRGSSSEGLALYPQVSLDRMFDSTHATLADGTTVPLGNLKERSCFTDEWAWDRFYSGEARSWLLAQPWDAMRFQVLKLWTGLIELRHTPYSTSAQGEATEYPPLISAVMLTWMGFARLVFFVLVFLLARDFKGGEAGRTLWTLALLAAGWAPYLLVFSYQRHVVPLLIMAGTVLIALRMQNRHSGLVSSVPLWATEKLQ